MLGLQTRLRLTSDQDALLGAFLGDAATLARTAYQRVATKQPGRLRPLRAERVVSWRPAR